MELTPAHFMSGDLRLEGVLHSPGAAPPFPAVVVCHPHPRYGGDMRNTVVLAVCEALARRGLGALRFNFRGVGGSQGNYSGGPGELQDTLAVLEHLGSPEQVDASRLGIAGYSFGATVALAAARESRETTAVAAVAPTFAALNDPELHQLWQPKLFAAGDQDHVVPSDQLRSLVQRFTQPYSVHILEDADHFLMGYEEEVGDLVAGFFAEHLA